MYDKYLDLMDEAGKIRNLKDRSSSCYKNYVSYFLNYMGKNPEELTCRDVRQFLLAKKQEGLKAATLNLYNSSIRFFYRNVLHILWDDITIPGMIPDHKLPTVISEEEVERLLDATVNLKYKTHLMEAGVEQRNVNGKIPVESSFFPFRSFPLSLKENIWIS